MDDITPFVPITERVLDEKHEVTWREWAKKAVEAAYRGFPSIMKQDRVDAIYPCKMWFTDDPNKSHFSP